MNACFFKEFFLNFKNLFVISSVFLFVFFNLSCSGKSNPEKIRIFYAASPGLKIDAQVLENAFHESGIFSGNDIKIVPQETYTDEKIDLAIFIEHIDKKILNNAKKKWFLINYEMLYDKDELDDIDLVLCKTKICEQKVREYRDENSLKFGIFYTGFTSLVPHVEEPYTKKKFDLIIHPAGKSPHKQTDKVLNVWRQNPSFPKIIVTCVDVNANWDCFHTHIKGDNSLANLSKYPNIEIHTKYLPHDEIEKLNIEAGLVVAPSEVEGFGHYLNEARGFASIIVTTDYPPMNELIRPSFGILVPSHTIHDRGILNAHTQSIKQSDLEAAVKEYLDLPISKKEEMSRMTLEAFEKDTQDFYKRMRMLLQGNIL